MTSLCPRCQAHIRGDARYCGRCGLPLASENGERVRAGFVRHRYPLPPPPGFVPFDDGIQLYFRFESAWGGERLLATEGFGLVLLNGGYALQDAVVRVCGVSAAGDTLFEGEYVAPDLPRGRETTVEVPSYDVPAPVQSLNVSLVSANFAPATEEVS